MAQASSKADIILGVQWGDEGKGRVVDSYAAQYDIVARFGGGDNAGHTLVVGEQTLALRIVPSGVLQAGPELFIGGGTVVGLDALASEIEMLATLGVDVSRIKVSDRAHVVFPYHAALDRASERARGEAALGTTGRGIGPAYADKAARVGITFGQLHRPDIVGDKLRDNLSVRAAQLGEAEMLPSADDTVAAMLARLPAVMPHVVDGATYVHDALARGKRILIEGAQGSLLDLGYGTYPFVTSSHTIAGGACTGLGIGPTAIGSVIGVAKAYCTRVGAGPFPSELEGEIGSRLRERGCEFGTVTGRPRRCGWFDAVAARYAAALNGLTSAVITKLDVLSGFERIAIVRDYSMDGRSVGFGAAGEPHLTVELEWFDGWSENISGVRRVGDLPAAARRYVEALERALTVPVEAVCVGPERSSLALPP